MSSREYFKRRDHLLKGSDKLIAKITCVTVPRFAEMVRLDIQDVFMSGDCRRVANPALRCFTEMIRECTEEARLCHPQSTGCQERSRHDYQTLRFTLWLRNLPTFFCGNVQAQELTWRLTFGGSWFAPVSPLVPNVRFPVKQVGGYRPM